MNKKRGPIRGGKRVRLGNRKEHPEIMTQGRTIEDRDPNFCDAYRVMFRQDVPEEYPEDTIAI